MLHVIDPKVTVNKEFSEEMKEKQEHRVRDIIINRIDMNYHSKVMIEIIQEVTSEVVEEV